MLEGAKQDIFDSNARKLLEKEFGEKFIDTDDLMQTLYNNKDWFNKIFSVVKN